jgi:hypothetical protein
LKNPSPKSGLGLDLGPLIGFEGPENLHDQSASGCTTQFYSFMKHLWIEEIQVQRKIPRRLKKRTIVGFFEVWHGNFLAQRPRRIHLMIALADRVPESLGGIRERGDLPG